MHVLMRPRSLKGQRVVIIGHILNVFIASLVSHLRPAYAPTHPTTITHNQPNILRTNTNIPPTGNPKIFTSPIYKSQMDYKKWLGNWVRHILSAIPSASTSTSTAAGTQLGPVVVLGGQQQRVVEMFLSCKGVLLDRSELSQFILPHAVVAYLQTLELEQREQREQRELQNDVLKEICCVLRGSDLGSQGGSNEHDGQTPLTAQPVQAVFSLLDTLGSWASLGLQLGNKSSTSSSSSSSSDKDKRKSNEAHQTGTFLSRAGVARMR